MKSALGRSRRQGRGRSLRARRHRARSCAARLHHAAARRRSRSSCCTAAATPRSRRACADLAGDEVDVLCVKGSGWDMAHDRAAPACPRCGSTPLRKLRARDALVRRGHGARAARQPARSDGAEPVGRDAAARLPAAQVRRPHPCRPRCSSLIDQPDGDDAVRGGLRRPHGLRALHHAGLRARQGRGRRVRARSRRSKA